MQKHKYNRSHFLPCIPFARSSKKSEGFIATNGENPILLKYDIASDPFPKNKGFPSDSNKTL
ncbi:hypothetical protein Hanom_Chr05g00465521 [Helianthus anomalus]